MNIDEIQVEVLKESSNEDTRKSNWKVLFRELDVISQLHHLCRKLGYRLTMRSMT